MIGTACGPNDREEKFVSYFKRKPGGRPPGKYTHRWEDNITF
jgi:hypothetical protein